MAKSHNGNASTTGGVHPRPQGHPIKRQHPSCEELLKTNYDRLHRFILRNTGHSSYAKDLLQQTMAEAVKSYPNFRGESAASTWLFGIARNVIRNYIYRSPSHRYQFIDSDYLIDMPDDKQSPENYALWQEHLSHISEAIEELPPKLKVVLSMVALEEKSYEIVSAELQISMGTVRSRLSRARSQLRQKLEERGAPLKDLLESQNHSSSLLG